MTSTEPMDEISLASLVPPPILFRDNLPGGDGQRYELRPADELSPTDLAHLEQLRQRAGGLFGKTVQMADENAAQAIEEAIDGMLAILAPGWPEARRQAVSYAHKIGLLELWHDRQAAFSKRATKSAGASRTARGKRSPASAPATASRPAK